MRVTSSGALLLLLGASACGAREDTVARDHSAVLSDGGVVALTRPPVAAAVAWNEPTTPAGRAVTRPQASCWLGDTLLVTDTERRALAVLDSSGAVIATVGSVGSPGQRLQSAFAVACSPRGGRVLLVDARAPRVHMLSGALAPVGDAPAPAMPKRAPFFPGSYAVADDGAWYDSWLAADLAPYLDAAEWQGVKLIRAWSPEGAARPPFGDPREYRDPVLRRVFNAPDLAVDGDTVWGLTRASAVIVGYDRRSGVEVRRIKLPVYHRGMRPVVEVGDPFPSGNRPNRAVYEPAARGLARLPNGGFAVIRYANWQRVERGGGFDLVPESSVDVYSADGMLVRSVRAPGYAQHLSANRHGRVALIYRDQDGGQRLVISPPLLGQPLARAH